MPMIRNFVTETTGSGLIGAGVEVAGGVLVPILAGGALRSGGSSKPPMRSRGWHKESYRHSLAARGVSTTYKIGGGPDSVPETPQVLVRNEIIESTKIPPGWSLDKCGYTGDKLENDAHLYEIWSVLFKNDRSDEQVRYFYVVKSKRKDRNTYGDPEVVDRFDHYDHALDWLAKSKQGKITRGDRP